MPTHFSDLKGRIQMLTADPANPVIGDEYFDYNRNYWVYWTGNNWLVIPFTTTSTSTTTTTTTSTSTTQTTTSTSTSITTSTSTSTTTTG